jgi:heat shock protein HslJ
MDGNITKEQFINLLYTFNVTKYPETSTSLNATGTQANTSTLSPLANTTRTLKEVDGKTVSGNYTLTFDDTMLTTKLCNGIGGKYTTSGNLIQGEFFQTEMLCLDEERGNLEQLFNLSGTTFLLTNPEGTGVTQLTLTTVDQHTFTYVKQSQSIGGQKDEHGCYLGAGYSRNEEAQECQRPREQTSTSGATNALLDNTEWKLINFNGKSLTGTYLLSFKQGQLSTKFCNTIQGSYTLSGEIINGTFLSTRMGCLAEEPSLLENGFSIDGGKLTLTTDTLILTIHENEYIRKKVL